MIAQKWPFNLRGPRTARRDAGRNQPPQGRRLRLTSRRDGADAVVMSLAHYESMMETLHLLATPANAAHLARSIAQHKAGKATRRERAQT